MNNKRWAGDQIQDVLETLDWSGSSWDLFGGQLRTSICGADGQWVRCCPVTFYHYWLSGEIIPLHEARDAGRLSGLDLTVIDDIMDSADGRGEFFDPHLRKALLKACGLASF